MRNICNQIVEALSDWWIYLGWLFFGSTLLIPYLANRSEYGLMAALIAGLLTLLWWIIDAVNQAIPWWMWFVGIVMLSTGMLPCGLILIIACWVIYWTKVRE